MTPATEAGAILVVLAERSGAEAALKAAYHAARALAHPRITALHVRVDPTTTILPTEEMLTSEQEQAMRRDAAREGEALHAVYEDWRRQLDPGVFAAWDDVVGTEAKEVAMHGTAAVLLVMAAPTPQSLGHTRTAFHAALFETHRPVLMVPATCEPGAIRQALIGWKDGDLIRKAVMEALPWLRQAEDVRVVSIGDTPETGVPAADHLLRELGVRGVARTIPPNGLSDGQRLLAEAGGADWLVMGAYRRNRLVEWVLGSVTETVLAQGHLPVFLVH